MDLPNVYLLLSSRCAVIKWFISKADVRDVWYDEYLKRKVGIPKLNWDYANIIYVPSNTERSSASKTPLLNLLIPSLHSSPFQIQPLKHHPPSSHTPPPSVPRITCPPPPDSTPRFSQPHYHSHRQVSIHPTHNASSTRKLVHHFLGWWCGLLFRTDWSRFVAS